MAEVVTRVESYIKGDENNNDKKAHDVKEHVPKVGRPHHQIKSNYTSPIKDHTTFKRVGKMAENFKPLNTHHELIWYEVLHLHNIPLAPTPKTDVMGSELFRWCKFYIIKGHHTEDFY